MFTFTSALGWALAVVSAVSVWPQAIRAWRLHSTQGLSLTTIAAACSTMIVWLFYTFEVLDIPAWYATAATLLALLVVLQVMLNLRHKGARRIVALLVVVSVICFWAWSAGFGYSLGWVAGAGSALWTLPQLRTALTETDLRAVSVPAFSLIALEALGWSAYGLLTGSLSYLVGPAVQLPSATIIAVRAWRSHQAH